VLLPERQVAQILCAHSIHPPSPPALWLEKYQVQGSYLVVVPYYLNNVCKYRQPGEIEKRKVDKYPTLQASILPRVL
jgi:hypothetical protein